MHVQFGYNSSKAAASHLTKMLSTEFALKNIPVRVCAVAPGVYESEMTYDTIGPDLVNVVGKGIIPVPANRPGTYVLTHLLVPLGIEVACLAVPKKSQELSSTLPRRPGATRMARRSRWTVATSLSTLLRTDAAECSVVLLICRHCCISHSNSAV